MRVSPKTRTLDAAFLRYPNLSPPLGVSMISFKNQSGMSLVSVLIAIGIAGILMANISTMLTNGFSGSAKISLDIDRDALKSMLLTSTSCGNTLTAGGCTAGTLLDLKRVHKDGSIRTIATKSGAGTKFGRITVRAECNSTGDGVVLRSALLSATGNLTSTLSSAFLPEPLTGKLVTWADQKSLLFLAGVEMCSNNGFHTLQSGLILQWVTGPDFKGKETSASTSVAFPKPFPNAVLNVQVTASMPSGTDRYQNSWFQITNLTKSQVGVLMQSASVVANKEIRPMIFAVGY